MMVLVEFIIISVITIRIQKDSSFCSVYLFVSRNLELEFYVWIVVVKFDLDLQRRGGRREQKWKEKAKVEGISTESEAASEVVTNALSNLRVTESNQPHIPITSVQFGNAQPTNLATPGLGHRAIWKPKAYGTTSGAAVVEGEKAPAVGTSIENKGSNAEIAANSSAIPLTQLLKGNQIEQFTVDNSAYTQAQIRATFYPKFENEKSDQEVFLFQVTLGTLVFLYYT